MKLKAMFGIVLGVLAAGVAAAGDLAVSAYWQDHMVLQRGKPITVWGKDAAGRTVYVSFANQTATAVTDSDGFWETTFAQPFALSATPQTLTISNNVNETIALSDVLVGDVFLASGQSNMDRRLEDTDKSNFEEPQSIKDFCRDDTGIRFLRIARSAENATAGEQLFDLPPLKPVNDTIKYYGEGYDWSPATGTNRNYVSSVALNFAHYIRRANEEKGQNIPIGIIHASSGGTFIREWIAPSVLIENDIDSPGYAASSDGWFWNNMMAPILRAKICAILWYQGCSDSRPDCVEVYKTMMDILVKDRRDRWGENGDLPFYAVQIGAPNYNSASGTIGLDKYPAPTEIIAGENYATIRERQRLWNMSDTGTHGLVTIVDCVDCLSNGALHPTDKNFVGRRLSLLARRDIYGETDLPAEGPTYTRAVRESDGSVRIFFKSGTAKGLTAGRMKPATDIAVSRWVKKDTDPIRGFAIYDENGGWQEAEATVEGETIVLRADGVATPTKFHYGYWCVTRETLQEDGQRLNLYNGDGLPMSPVAPQAVEDAATSGQVADPVLTPGSCLFSPSTNVTISCATAGTTVRYTLDGSEPTATNAVYSVPIAISATTTVKARAFAANKDPSDIVFATYTLGEAPAATADPQWTVSSYDASSWSPLSGNILAGKTGTISGSVAFASSGYNNNPDNLTDASVPSTPDNSAYVGFQENSSVSWTFDEPQTIETIRFTTQRTAGDDSDVSRAYGGLRIEDVYVRTSGSSEWEPLGTPIYQKGGTVGGFMLATLADDGVGLLAENVVALKVVFLRSEYYWFNVAEVEATGHATAGGGDPIETVATPAFDPASCSFFPSTNVALSCATDGATIRYTLNGNAPTATSDVYSAPIAISATTTVKARAYKNGMNPSGVATATFTLSAPSTPPDDPTVTTNGMWISSSCAPANWTALANNLLAGRTGTISGGTAGATYASTDPNLLTDGSVPTAGGTAWIVGFLNNASISWTFSSPVTLEQVRVSCGYLAQTGYSGFTVSAIEVQSFGSTDWTAVSTEAGQMSDTGKADILSLLLADGSGSPLAENIAALRVTFATPPVGFANYCAEIEAVGTAEGGEPVATVASPTFDPASCSFYPSTNVALACATEGATIRYTLDGSEPTAESEAYETPIALSATTTVKARAFVTNMNPSAVATATYTYAEPSPPTPPPSGDKMFYIGETGYDSWADAYNAAQNGDTITVGENATFAMSGNKSLTINLAGQTLEWAASGWMNGSLTVVDTVGGGELGLASGNQNVNGGTVDLSSLTGDQLTGTGKFYSSAGTMVKFPSDMSYSDCTAKIALKSASEIGARIVVQGGTYTWDGSSWVPEGHDITIAAPQNGTLETSATNNVAAGTVVTVTAIPAAGYRLASVTTNGAALAGATFAMPAEDVTLAATFEEEVVPPPPGDGMFYIGETSYDSWTNAFAAATNGATIVVGENAVLYHPRTVAINKDLTIDLCGRTLEFTQGWLTGHTISIIDTGAPARSGRFTIVPTGMNISGGTLDLSALSDDQVTGYFQMSSTSLLKSPSDRSEAYTTTHLWFDAADPAHGVGARIVVRGLTYEWDGVSWGIAFRITSIAVDDEYVELGVLVAPEYGVNPNVTILGCETVNGQFQARPDATTDDGSLYRLPVTEDRFFQAKMGMPD